jgi:hypothetical protein
VKFVSAPLAAVSVPSAVLVRVHAYVIPLVGQVELHVGVAVKGCLVLATTVGEVGSNDTEFRVSAVTVITVCAPLVVAPSVTLTYSPTVPTVVPAVKVVVVLAAGLMVPSAVLVSAHA